MFVGWGNLPWISEHKKDGSPVFAATYTQSPYNTTAMNYRAFSFEGWESTPANTRPSVFSYSYSKKGKNYIYVSWNGATTVDSYRYYGAEQDNTALYVIGRDERKGKFEKLWVAPAFYPMVMVEALDGNGTSLRNSTLQSTFVPSDEARLHCGPDRCDAMFQYSDNT